jgi:parvulin-like peptidyl-prolyl isomerase
MSKKDAEREKEEEKDLDEDEEEEEEEEEDEEEEEEEEEEHSTSARASAGRARPRARRAHDDHADDHGHGHDEDEEEGVDADDPYWWTPHAVMSVLVLLGVLGFFGAFNRFVPKGVVAQHAPAEEHATTASHETGHGSEAPRPMPQQAQQGQAEMFGAKHLLVQYKGSMRAGPNITRTEEEAKARATEAMKKARGGMKFEDVVKEYSDEPGAAQRGGDLGKFRKGQMVPEFQDAVEKMKVGQISDLVKTPFGYHVIQRTQ